MAFSYKCPTYPDQQNCSQQSRLHKNYHGFPKIHSTDPLALEASTVVQTEKSCKRYESEVDSPAPAKKPWNEDPKKKEAANMDLSSVFKAFADASAAMVAAIDRNSRAVRCQGTASDALVKEMKEVNRRLSFLVSKPSSF